MRRDARDPVRRLGMRDAAEVVAIQLVVDDDHECASGRSRRVSATAWTWALERFWFPAWASPSLRAWVKASTDPDGSGCRWPSSPAPQARSPASRTPGNEYTQNAPCRADWYPGSTCP